MKEVGIMLDFNPREYSIRELFDSYNRKETILSPKFQRRPVWEYKAKSYLIDSILSGLPIPRIFIRERTNLDMSATREIIDGQQRLKAIFDFLNDGFKVSKVHNKQYGGLSYSDLPDDVKRDFLKYPISAILLIDLDDNAVFDIFARLNTYSVKLNSQELLNSQFFGVYKQLVYRLAQEYRTFWIDSKLLSEKSISRMEDAKLVSDLLSVIVEQKITSNSFEQSKRLYAKFEDDFEDAENIENSFKATLDLFCKVYPENFAETAFSKAPLFYSTFIALYHLNYPISAFGTTACPVGEREISKIRTVLDEINTIANSTLESIANTEDASFVVTLKKNTTTPEVRNKRCKYIVRKLYEALEQSL